MELTKRNLSYELQTSFIELNSENKICKPEYSFATNETERKKCTHPRSPHMDRVSYAANSCSGMGGAQLNNVQSVSMTVGHTPPAKRYQKVRNPFEAALTERLHLPLIASPSLFQRPATPQMSSTQFEWTIDEVSSLIPANVEAHETQFQDSPDPDLEAKAQMAINSYFKEQEIVPSPVDCPLRNRRIILSEMNGNTPVAKPGRRIRDCSSQTELTLPPQLPPSLEDALKPYFQPHLAGVGVQWPINRFMQSTYTYSMDDIRDASLRRKLFDMQNVKIVENDTKEVVTNTIINNGSPTRSQTRCIVGKLSDSLDKSSFGSLSPISAYDSLPPLPTSTGNRNDSITKRITRLSEDGVQLSPIQKPQTMAERSPNLFKNTKTNISCREGEKFLPERSSSPLVHNRHHFNSTINTDNIAEFSADSFNIKVSRLKVNTSGRNRSNALFKKEEDQTLSQDDTVDVLENNESMDEMQYTSQSSPTSNSSNNSEITPRSRRLSINRKNLSQSFTVNCQNNREMDSESEEEANNVTKPKQPFPESNEMREDAIMKTINNEFLTQDKNPKLVEINGTMQRTDSGFNEMSNHNGSSSEDGNILVACCSTPTKLHSRNFI